MTTNPLDSNMVEDARKAESLAELFSKLLRVAETRVTLADLEFDLGQIERDDGFNEKSEREKIAYVLKASEKEIRKWNEELSLEHNLNKMDYSRWKKKVVERFCSRSLTLSEFFQVKQNEEEKIGDYVRRMEICGRKLKLTGNVRLQAIKLGIRRFPKQLLEVLIGEEKITEKVINSLREREALEERFSFKFKKSSKPKMSQKKQFSQEKQRKVICYTCGKAGHIASNCSTLKGDGVNEIEEAETGNENKSTLIYFSKKSFNPIFDSGSESNYLTQTVLKQLNRKSEKLQKPEKKFTCLGEAFLVKEYIELSFSHKSRTYTEIFKVLPRRRDACIILGRQWLKKLKEVKPNLENAKRLSSFRTLLEKFFAGERDGIRMDYACPIDIPEESRVISTATPIPQALEGRVRAEVNRLLNLGYIRVSNSSWCNRVKPIVKENGDIRLTTNLIMLNKHVPLDRYSLPKLDEMLCGLRGAKFFTKLDFKEGFFQVRLKESDCHKTAFRIKNQLYEWTRMPMGFKNAPAVFQRLIDMILRDEIGNSCVAYVDDILIYGQSKEELQERTEIIVRKLVEAGLRGNREKCQFGKEEIDFVGHRVKENSIEPMVKHKNSIEEFPEPSDVESVRRFLGMVNYYRKFIPNCSKIAEPLNSLLKKDVKFHWDEKARRAFKVLKQSLQSQKLLSQPDFRKEFILETDACNSGLGAVLSQNFEGVEKPIAYASRTLQGAEKNYSITEKEMLGALWGMEYFKYHLYGREFVLRTDHKALEAFNTKGFLESARAQRWLERLQEFNFRVEYVPGKTIPHVDALSRMHTVFEVGEEAERLCQEIVETHRELIHRGAKVVLEKMKERGIDGVNEALVKKAIGKCRICKLYNPIRNKGYRSVEAFFPGERVAFDIMEPERKQYILVAIDYFTRMGFAQVVQKKTSGKVLEFLKKVQSILPIKTLVTDGARENLSKKVEEWLGSNAINRHTTSPYHHESNGRVERFNRTIWEGIRKINKPGTFAMRIKKIIEAYNQTYHRAIGMSPLEAQKEENWEQVRKMQFYSRIKHNQKRCERWKEFKEGNLVLLKNDPVLCKREPKFKEQVEIKGVLGQDTYLVSKRSNKIYKRHASQLREA